jgi:hypothetical protein
MVISLARLIEGMEDISVMPNGGTAAIRGNQDYDVFITSFNFTIMRGRDAFETLLFGGHVKRNRYSSDLTDNNSFKQAMQTVVEAALPPAAAVTRFIVSVEVDVMVDACLHWQTPKGRSYDLGAVHNQVADPSKVKVTWNNLRFRSESERRVAIELDRAGVLFLPNCMGRLSAPAGRKNLECDFLVCQDGKWGILEVDGEPWHPASRAAQDHERDRLFKAYGILVIERFNAGECFENAEGVVQQFLSILRRA